MDVVKTPGNDIKLQEATGISPIPTILETPSSTSNTTTASEKMSPDSCITNTVDSVVAQAARMSSKDNSQPFPNMSTDSSSNGVVENEMPNSKVKRKKPARPKNNEK